MRKAIRETIERAMAEGIEHRFENGIAWRCPNRFLKAIWTSIIVGRKDSFG